MEASLEVRHPLPHNWKCRSYQAPLWRYLDGGGKRAVAVWHRRAGKDSVALRWTTVASQRRVGTYWHMLPTLRQGRKVIWEGMDYDGNRFLDAWPGWRNPGKADGIVSHIRHDEMKVELHNGSIWYVTGSDNYDALMGTNPIGVVFSEWSLSKPEGWDYILPILIENGGWALFIYTPRGRNHGWKTYRDALSAQDWFTQVLTVDDTGAVAREKIEAAREAGWPEAKVLQEFWCSFDAPVEGAIWGEELVKAEQEGRITRLPHQEELLVDTWWDIGFSDATAVWFVQNAAGEIHVIDYDEAEGRTPAQDVQMLRRKAEENGYTYGRHIWPFDGGAKTKASKGKPLYTLYADLGINPEVQPRQDVEVAIQRGRQLLKRSWFDSANCAAGLDALRSFRKRQDEDKSTPERPYYLPGYVHDWASHGATAFYTGALAWESGGLAARVQKPDRYAGRTERRTSEWSA